MVPPTPLHSFVLVETCFALISELIISSYASLGLLWPLSRPGFRLSPCKLEGNERKPGAVGIPFFISFFPLEGNERKPGAVGIPFFISFFPYSATRVIASVGWMVYVQRLSWDGDLLCFPFYGSGIIKLEGNERKPGAVGIPFFISFFPYSATRVIASVGWMVYVQRLSWDGDLLCFPFYGSGIIGKSNGWGSS
ncbi:hypothetical protein QE152_g11169 [Popillia japonica]|uniref:Uncharacterized protein n=1 Tax=Popillia japonica TaxID=7064 RepID=A0AAW1LLW4_POPJA